MFVHINIANNYQPFKETTKAKYVMAIFGLLLKSIFLVALLVAVFIIGVMVYMYMRVKQMARHFAAQGKAAKGASAGRRTTSAGNGSTWSNSSSTNNSRTTGGSRTTTDSSQTSDIYEELYDERPAQQANRKIFGKDEGDYVDFEEV